jgi:endo-alpha-1,4-polygalactosaminidase (GH114 family)
MYAKQKEQQDRQEQRQDKMIEEVEKAANKKTNEFKVYPQAGSTANLGCQMQSPEFKVIPPSKAQQPALESNKEGDEGV